MAAATLKADRGLGQRIATLLLVGGVAYLFAALAASGDAPLREVLLRYAFVAAGVFAIAPPHLLLPDRSAAWLQVLNPSPRALLARQGRPWAFVVAAFLVPPVVLAAQLGGAWVQPLVEAWLVILGAGAYAFHHYTGIGPVSQAWQEGTAGHRYRRLVERDQRANMQIPPGLVPTVLASARIFGLAAVVILATALAVTAGAAWLAPVPAAALLGWTSVRLARRVSHYDRDFYQTNALYTELLMRGGTRATEREPISYDAVYWAPRRFRPHVWASLRQLDRRLPLGRIFALGVLGFGALLVWDAAPGAVAAYLLLALGAKNAAVALLTAEPLAPRAFDLALQSSGGWTTTRFFVNLRWTLPLAGALALGALFDPTFRLADAVLWIGVDLLLALLLAWLVTYAAEHRYRRRFA